MLSSHARILLLPPLSNHKPFPAEALDLNHVKGEKKICLSALTMCIASTSQFPQYSLAVFILTTPTVQKGLLSPGGQVARSNDEGAYGKGGISACSSQILMLSMVNASLCTPIDSPVPNATASTSQEGFQPKSSSSILHLD